MQHIWKKQTADKPATHPRNKNREKYVTKQELNPLYMCVFSVRRVRSLDNFSHISLALFLAPNPCPFRKAINYVFRTFLSAAIHRIGCILSWPGIHRNWNYFSNTSQSHLFFFFHSANQFVCVASRNKFI